MKTGFVGILLTFCLIVPAIVLVGSEGFLNLPSLIICIGLPIALSLASTGTTEPAHALLALRCIIVPHLCPPFLR